MICNEVAVAVCILARMVKRGEIFMIKDIFFGSVDSVYFLPRLEFED